MWYWGYRDNETDQWNKQFRNRYDQLIFTKVQKRLSLGRNYFFNKLCWNNCINNWKECISTPTSNHAQNLIQNHHKSKCKNPNYNDFKLDVGKYFLQRTQKALTIKEKNWLIHKNKSTYLSKQIVKKIDKAQTEWKDSLYIKSNKGLISKTILKTPTNQANTTNGQPTQIDTSKEKETHKCLTNT